MPFIESATTRLPIRALRSAGAPVAIAGSLALLMSAVPAGAAESVRIDQRMPRSLGAHDGARLTAPASVPRHAAAPTWVVQPGDTVTAIAARHALRTEDVLALNGLDWSSIIRPGQVLVLSTAAPSAPVEPPPAAPAAPAGGSHVVVAGDTMSGIAARHDITTDALLAANGLERASIIYPGQQIVIPAAAPALVAHSAPAAPAASTTLDAEQIANAQIIIAVGRGLGVPDRGIAIALGTAMQESWLRNLDWGDRDSLGLFQQRPSTGWGTEAEVRDPVRAAHAFYGGTSDPNGHLTRGLLDIDGWESLSFAEAAQAVQVSAYPDRYAQWEQPAHAWLAAHG